MSQAWAGAGFGNLVIPHVGQEVMVDFFNGDPNQPIIVGRIYHQDNRSPDSLPGTKAQMTIRPKTYKGGGFNELRFKDAMGQEQVYTHAQKNMDTEVLNNRTTDMKVDHTETIGNNQSITVELGQTVKVGKGNADGHDQIIVVAHDQSTTTRNNQILRMKNDRTASTSHDDGLYVTNDQKVTVEGKQEHTATGDRISLVGGSHCLEMEGGLARKVADALRVKVQGSIILESNSQISLKVGSLFVIIQAGGVNVMESKINLNSGGSPGTPVGTLLPGVLEALVVDAGDGQDNGSSGGNNGGDGDQDGSGGGDGDQDDPEKYYLRFHSIDNDCVPYADIKCTAHFADGTQEEGTTDDEGYAEVFIKGDEEEMRSHLFL